jgi:hypothetical protein
MKTIVLIILLVSSAMSQLIAPYISPGLVLSWNNNKSKTVSYKISLGIMNITSYDFYGSYGINITYGKRIVSPKNERNYSYAEIEGGILNRLGKFPLLSGLGVGAAWYRNKKLSPKFSFFSGDIIFFRSDIAKYNEKLDMDIGGMLVIPITYLYFFLPALGTSSNGAAGHF